MDMARESWAGKEEAVGRIQAGTPMAADRAAAGMADTAVEKPAAGCMAMERPAILYMARKGRTPICTGNQSRFACRGNRGSQQEIHREIRAHQRWAQTHLPYGA